MIKEMVEAFVEAKMERADISAALYRVAGDLGGPALVKRAGQRSRKAVEAMLQTVTDVKFPPDKFAVDLMLSAMAGAMRALLEAGPTPPRSANRESNSCFFVSRTWRRRQLSAFGALKMIEVRLIFPGPVGGVAVVFVQAQFVPAADGQVVVPGRAFANGVARNFDVDLAIGPTHSLDPLRSDQNFLARPPILSVNDRVTDFPGFPVEEKIFQVANFTVGG